MRPYGITAIVDFTGATAIFILYLLKKRIDSNGDTHEANNNSDYFKDGLMTGLLAGLAFGFIYLAASGS